MKSSNIATVKPDATPEEINAVVNDVQGGGDQIFAQAVSPRVSITVMSTSDFLPQLTSSTRYGESRAAYREVQDRHEDIRRIEQTLEELAQLFNDVMCFSPLDFPPITDAISR